MAVFAEREISPCSALTRDVRSHCQMTVASRAIEASSTCVVVTTRQRAGGPLHDSYSVLAERRHRRSVNPGVD